MTNNNHNVCFMFPGQGAQYVGMGKDFFEQTDIGRSLFSTADEILEFPLSETCFQGPEKTLTQTENTQPALFVCSVIAYELLKQKGLEPSLVLGHSLGEYTALYAAGAFDFTTGLRLVRKRGTLMQHAGEDMPGTMAAIIGLDFDTVEQVCTEVKEEMGKEVVTANFNSPNQLVISGDVDAVKQAGDILADKGAKRVIPLKVSGAFHSALMEHAAEKFKAFLQEQTLHNASLNFINNADAQIIARTDEIKDSLARQLTSCVLWTKSVTKAIAGGCSPFVEAGPGKVLSGLLRRIDRSAKRYPAGTLEHIENTVAALKENQ